MSCAFLAFRWLNLSRPVKQMEACDGHRAHSPEKQLWCPGKDLGLQTRGWGFILSLPFPSSGTLCNLIIIPSEAQFANLKNALISHGC